MADDVTLVTSGVGGLPTGTKFATRDGGASGHIQQIDAFPGMPAVVAGAQYNLTVGAAVVTLTVPGTATHALISVETGDVRFTEDASSPSGTNGLYLAAGSLVELPLPNALKFYRAGTVDAKINVTYRRYV